MFWVFSSVLKQNFHCFLLTLDILVLPICIGNIAIIFIHAAHKRAHHKSAWKIKLQWEGTHQV